MFTCLWNKSMESHGLVLILLLGVMATSAHMPTQLCLPLFWSHTTTDREFNLSTNISFEMEQFLVLGPNYNVSSNFVNI